MTVNTFGIARCTVSVIKHEIYSILSNNVAETLINFPQQKKGVIHSFIHAFIYLFNVG